MADSPWKQRLTFIVPSCCIILAGIFIILSTITIPAFLKATVADELKMAPDTYEYWGQSPGKADSVTNRNFTFFNFTNPREFLYQNATPVFTATHGYLLMQNDNFTDLKYSDDMNEVFFNNWYFFTEINGTKSLQTKVNTLNFGPLGFWYQLDLVGMPTFALQGFGGLYVELSQTFKTQAIGQGVNSQFLPNYTNWRAVCDNAQISEEQCNNTWEDPQYGLSDQNNYEIWIDFGYFNDDASENYLKSYFGFDDMQIQSLQAIFYDWSDALNDILQNWFCNGTSCNSNYLTLLQLSSGQVTSNPPSGDAVDSICDTGNITCIGQPQISKYLKNEFKKNFPEEKYQKLKFSVQTFSQLFTPYRGTLLNIGNLTQLFETGYKFDSAETLKEQDSYLTKIQTQTHAETKDHAFVVWEWVKYFTSEFVIKKSKGGSEKNSGIGGVFSQAFYQSFTGFGDWVMEDYLNVLGEEQINNCDVFVKETISGIPDEKAAMICAPIKNKKVGYSTLFEPCFASISSQQKFRVANNLKVTEFGEYCDDEQKSFLTVALQIHQKIFDQYSCNKNKGVKKCSPYELSLKQFINSSVTLNPIQNTIKTYSKSLTGKDWSNNLAEFEYKNFLNTALGNESSDSQVFTERQLIDLLSFDKLFSAPMVMELMIENDPVIFEKLYYWKNMTLLKTFVKFITIEVGFGGFIQQRTVKQLLFGYEDPFLEGLKQTDTMMGGDPSINPIIMLSDPNITQQEAYLFPYSTYTGYSDIEKVRQYASLYGYRYITYNKTWYDGYEVKSEFVNPYRTLVPVNGTDSLQNPPNLDEKSSIYCLITSIYRTAKLDFSQNDEMFGMDLLSFRPSRSFLGNQQQVPYNRNYYQKFEGFHNVTFLGVPFHVSKNNFYSCPSNWSQLVKVYDEKFNYEIKASPIDDTVLKVEPNTGTLFFGTVRLQTNYHFQSDELFASGDRMLPVTNVIREGAIDESTVDQLLGDLRFALKMEKVLLILATIMIPLSLIFITYRCYVTGNKKSQQEKEINDSLIEKDSLATENVSISIGSSSGLIESVKEQRESNDGLVRRLQEPEQPHARRSDQEPKDKVEERIVQVDTIIFEEDEEEKKKPETTVSVFQNINGTIIDQD